MATSRGKCVFCTSRYEKGVRTKPRCPRCRRMVRQVTKEHAKHTDYPRHFCLICNAEEPREATDGT